MGDRLGIPDAVDETINRYPVYRSVALGIFKESENNLLYPGSSVDHKAYSHSFIQPPNQSSSLLELDSCSSYFVFPVVFCPRTLRFGIENLF